MTPPKETAKIAISVKGLSKEFISKYKELGLKGSFKAMFHPQMKKTKAVDNISFEVKKGVRQHDKRPDIDSIDSWTFFFWSPLEFSLEGKISLNR